MSTTDITATNPRDVYARVTAQIINAIEQGVGNWRMPWHTSGRYAFSPINAPSKKPYRGINTVCLWAAAQAKGYERGEWATYQQWQDRGAQVRKGEKATLVVFWKFANESAETDDGESSRSSRLLFTRGYSVFNAAQVDGYTPPADADTSMPEPIAHAEAFFQAIGADLRHGGNQAYLRLPRITSRCRPSAHSRRTCPTIRPSPMSIRTGQHPRRAVTANSESVSAITPMPLKS